MPDQTFDNSKKVLRKIASVIQLPSYVQEAPVLTKAAADALPNSAFALPYERQYPVDTPANTWLSMAYFVQDPPVLDSLPQKQATATMVMAAATHGILGDVNALLQQKSAVATVEKKAEAPQTYGAVIKSAGKDVGHFPLNRPGQVVEAQTYFNKHSAHYDADTRRVIATAIVKAARDMGVPVSSAAVASEAGILNGTPDINNISRELEVRAFRLKQAQTQMPFPEVVPSPAGNAYEHVWALVVTAPAEILTKAAADLALAVAKIDDAHGMRELYGRELTAPALFFNPRPNPADLRKSASAAAAADTLTMGGYEFSLTKLAEIGSSNYIPIFGVGVVADLLADGGGIDKVKLAQYLGSCSEAEQYVIADALVNG